MFLELLNNAVMDSSFFYFYFGITLVSFGMMYLIDFHPIESVTSNYFLSDEHQNIKIKLNQMKKPLIINESFIVWLIITFKRIDEKDDKEDNSSSYFTNEFKIRGGQIWKETYCSQPLKNIVL